MRASSSRIAGPSVEPAGGRVAWVQDAFAAPVVTIVKRTWVVALPIAVADADGVTVVPGEVSTCERAAVGGAPHFGLGG